MFSSRARQTTALVGIAVLLAACGGAPEQQRPPSAASEAPRESQAPDGSFTVVATGDVLIHPALTDQAKEDGNGKIDYRPLLAGIKPLISGADLGICHLETPLAPKGGPYSGYPSFSAPPEIVDALKDTGYDNCSTASNHTIDQGVDGATRTLDKLDEAGIKHTGSARSAEEAEKPLIVDVNGVKVAQISFAYGFNGIKVPAGKPWLVNQIDAEDVIAEAKAARKAGAQVVLASLHWGTEYQHEPTAEQRSLAKKLLGDDSIDLIIGHHAHVVQPFEQINGKWVAYGLGNSVARHSEPKGSTEQGAAARFRFVRDGERWKVGKAEYVPTLVRLGPPIRLLDLTAGQAGNAGAEALKATDEVVLSRGAGDRGLTRPGR
ncbi:CapA family protein [Amycolatopsis decaplanina]|uniref:Poly-gamma-glutamate synthesis protein involved in capsule biosynthesis n=1 Tax=Amycolatopsis decaplanina DSM 44594 TaxID=1284240 RepID=M2YX24_9PSEU|nr:CapA family protein [Amycolatopsis decaplanina]EME52899.1 poly-gamma-glutamate synthesis protein involved in capsule biosynthesis [Amycolatopsis decaplanina DSM 44594]